MSYGAGGGGLRAADQLRSVTTSLGMLPGASGAALAARTFMTPQSLNELLAGLDQRGLVVRTPHPTHGRIIEARLTSQGEAALRKAETIVFGIEERMLAPLSTVQRDALSDMLERCRQALSDAAVNPRRRKGMPGEHLGVDRRPK